MHLLSYSYYSFGMTKNWDEKKVSEMRYTSTFVFRSAEPFPPEKTTKTPYFLTFLLCLILLLARSAKSILESWATIAPSLSSITGKNQNSTLVRASQNRLMRIHSLSNSIHNYTL